MGCRDVRYLPWVGELAILVSRTVGRVGLGRTRCLLICQRNSPKKLKSKMGAKVSRVTRLMKKPLETQRSVEKILERKPRPAPLHPSSQAVLAEERKREWCEEILPDFGAS